MTAAFELAAPANFRLDLTVWALRRTPNNDIDRWDGSQWTRRLHIGPEVVPIAVRQTGQATAPRLVVRFPHVGRGRVIADKQNPSQVAERLRWILGLDVDTAGFERLAAHDPQLAPLVRRFAGLRPPRLPSLFEALANAVACQQVSLASGLSLLGKTAASLAGKALDASAPPPFPTPAEVLHAGAARLRQLGWSERKADYLLGCARAVNSGDLDVATLASASDEQVISRLSRLRGIKRWSAQYVALRGLGRLAVLPVDDVGAHRHLANVLVRPRLDATAMETLAQRWRPYAGLVYFLLLLSRLDAQGRLAAPLSNDARVDQVSR